MSIKNLNYFCFVFCLLFLACDNDTVADLPITDERIIWSGTNITFDKAEGSDPTLAENQDRLTDNVWLTRGNDGGQIFNIKLEENYSKADSPSGVLWSIGTIGDLDNLTFGKFRSIVEKPKDIVGENLVAFLTEDNIYLSIKFTKWSDKKAGGFAYERSSK